MPEIKEEIMIFLIAVIAGVIVRLCYRCISCFREIVKHSLWVMGIEDVLFWIGSALYLFVQIYHTSDGSIRWHFILGVVLGAIFASVLLRKYENVAKKIYAKKSKKSSKNLAKKNEKRYYN